MNLVSSNHVIWLSGHGFENCSLRHFGEFGSVSVTIAFLADRPESVPQVAQWWYDAWGQPESGDSVEAWSQGLRNNLNRDRLPIQVAAIAGGNVIGTAVFKLHEMKDLYPDKPYWLGNVFVDPEFRGHRIASALVLRIVELAKAHGANVLHLQTQRLDGGLYARLGWERIEQVHYRNYEALVMRKPL